MPSPEGIRDGGGMLVYHERQLGALCGVHCLNNLLQGPHFGPGDLAEIGVQLDNQEQELMQSGGGGSSASDDDAAPTHQPYNVDSSADGGNFSIQVLTLALRKHGLELLPAKHPDAAELMKDPTKAASAFLCQYHDHWFTVREVGTCWWNLNSTRQRPGLVSPFYLAAWLTQLNTEGYTIFLVLGGALPTPMKPSKPDCPEDTENFHDLFDLLSKSKDPADRPCGGGESAEPDEATAAAIREAQGGHSATDHTAASIRSQEAAFQGGAFQGAAMPGTDPLLAAIRRQEAAFQAAQMSARGGSASYNGGALPSANVAAAQAPMVVGQPVGQMLPGQVIHRSVPASDQYDLSGGYNGSTRSAARGYLQQPMGSTQSTSSSSRHEPMDVKSLKEMGFKESQLRAAAALQRGGAGAAAELLLRVKGVDVKVERDGRLLAEELQKSVLALDQSEVNPQAVLQLVSLLCLDSHRLSAAAEHFDASVLSDYLLSVLFKRGQLSLKDGGWPPELAEAVSVAVELLASSPGLDERNASVAKEKSADALSSDSKLPLAGDVALPAEEEDVGTVTL